MMSSGFEFVARAWCPTHARHGHDPPRKYFEASDRQTGRQILDVLKSKTVQLEFFGGMDLLSESGQTILCSVVRWRTMIDSWIEIRARICVWKLPKGSPPVTSCVTFPFTTSSLRDCEKFNELIEIAIYFLRIYASTDQMKQMVFVLNFLHHT